MTSKTTIEMTATIIEYARLKQVHICEDFPLMRAEEKAKKYEKIDKITTQLFNGLVTVDEAARAIANV